MSSISFKQTMTDCPDQNLEWVYLVNETLAGEKTIVPLLRQLMSHPIVSGPLRNTVECQLNEEVEHVRLFHKLVGHYRLDRSLFRSSFINFVDGLPTVTLKLFAMQGMLEGLALGALHFRLYNIENSPSYEVDSRALEEELNHTEFSFPHFRQLIHEEGPQSLEQFRNASRGANEVFASCFNGKQVEDIYKIDFGVSNLNADKIEASAAMVKFKHYTRKYIVHAKNAFIRQYQEALLSC